MTEARRRVLFLCIHNSARSQMAEGWLRHLGSERFEAHSAGIEGTSVRPLAIRAMQEAGVDISGQRPKSLDEYRGQAFEWVITVCDEAAEACPSFPGPAQRLHWPLPDPARVKGGEGEQLAVYRHVRDALRAAIEAFVAQVPDPSDSR